jgi:hypothetical protein
MKLSTLASLSVLLLACGAKPGTDDTGTDLVDADKDGFTSDIDCDDSDADINPDALETCDGVDNDCDTEVDESDAEDATAWYADADGDGYGDANTSVTACESPSDHVSDSTDCDDENASANPGMAEVCDGVDNDCDSATTEDSTVAWTDQSGTVSDVTADFSGTENAPASFTLPEGSINFCEGTYYVNLSIEGSASIHSQSQDPTNTILNGGGTGPVVQVNGDLMDVEISDLTLTGGEALNLLPLLVGAPAGGGLFCSSADENDMSLGEIKMDLNNVLVTGNHSTFFAGGLFSLGCDLTVNNSEISFNQSDLAVGGIMAVVGDHTLNGVDIVSNDSTQSYAGAYFGPFEEGESNADLTDVIVANNAALDVPGIGLQEGTYTWTGSAGPEGSGVWNNTGVDTALGALLIMQAEFTADTVDFGVTDSSSDNAFMDISFVDDDSNLIEYVAGDDASFTCNANECGTAIESTPDTGVIPIIEGSVPEGRAVFQVFEATSQQTLMGFDMVLSSSETGCEGQFLVLKSETSWLSSGGQSTHPWEIAWLGNNVSVDYSAPTQSGSIGLVLEPGTTYATGVHIDCGLNLTAYVDSNYTMIPQDLGFGSFLGYAMQEEFDAELSEGDSTQTDFANALFLEISFFTTEL